MVCLPGLSSSVKSTDECLTPPKSLLRYGSTANSDSLVRTGSNASDLISAMASSSLFSDSNSVLPNTSFTSFRTFSSPD